MENENGIINAIEEQTYDMNSNFEDLKTITEEKLDWLREEMISGDNRIIEMQGKTYTGICVIAVIGMLFVIYNFIVRSLK